MNAIEWLLEIPRRFGAREFLYDVQTGESVSFSQMHENAARIGADLRRRGLVPGDRVVLLLENSAAFAKLYLGCLYAGVVATPVNPILSQREIQQIVGNCDARLVVVSAETAGLIELASTAAADVPLLVLQDGRSGQQQQQQQQPEGAGQWDFAALPPAGAFQPLAELTPEDTISLVFTSGTTGMPTGVVHRIADMIDNARVFCERMGIDENNRFYGILAMTYLGGYYNLLMLPYCAGASVVLGQAFDARAALNFWDLAAAHDVNTLWLVPTILAILLEMDRGTAGEAFCRQHVELALVGTAPLPVRLRKQFESRYGVPLYENYGLSETFFISTNSPTTPVMDGCVGRLLPGVQLTVTGADGQPLPYGQEGELRVCTPHLMQGTYLLESRQIDPADRAAWFATGDTGVLMATGDVYITGRKKNLIIRGGINISPVEIENVIHEHEAVAQCAVVGIPHPLYGEDIAAAIRFTEGSIQDHKESITAFCRERLGALKRPAHLIELAEFPLSSTGKVQHQKVREILASKLGKKLEAPQPPVSSSPTGDGEEGALMLSGRVRRTRPSVRPDVVEGLARFPTSIISDVMNRLGMMHSAIRPLVTGRPFCGPALTVEEVEGGNLMSHAASEMILPGDVLVIDAKAVTSRACWGGLQTLMAAKKGAAALVINGVVRDYETIAKQELPVYALGVSPGGPFKGWGGNINYPIACGGVVVNPGDIIVGDDDGVVVVSHEIAESVVDCCQRRLALEDVWFQRVEAGETTVDVVGLREKIEQLGVRAA